MRKTTCHASGTRATKQNLVGSATKARSIKASQTLLVPQGQNQEQDCRPDTMSREWKQGDARDDVRDDCGTTAHTVIRSNKAQRDDQRNDQIAPSGRRDKKEKIANKTTMTVNRYDQERASSSSNPDVIMTFGALLDTIYRGNSTIRKRKFLDVVDAVHELFDYILCSSPSTKKSGRDESMDLVYFDSSSDDSVGPVGHRGRHRAQVRFR